MNTNKVGQPNDYNALAFETVTPQKRLANSTCDHLQPSKIAKITIETEVSPVKNEPLLETNDPTENGTSHGVTTVPARDCFPLLAMPSEPLLRILGYLSHRDIVAIEKTCLDLRNLATSILTVRSQAWYAQFETSQKQQFTRIAKNSANIN
ncbi:F-box protein [Endozoicomonas sp. ALC013]|uniref:F-box protein n=1 Tax=Endozoicomonas sp. ALC013 TaxID=3403076 RepID=UPI003BB493D5